MDIRSSGSSRGQRRKRGASSQGSPKIADAHDILPTAGASGGPRTLSPHHRQFIQNKFSHYRKPFSNPFSQHIVWANSQTDIIFVMCSKARAPSLRRCLIIMRLDLLGLHYNDSTLFYNIKETQRDATPNVSGGRRGPKIKKVVHFPASHVVSGLEMPKERMYCWSRLDMGCLVQARDEECHEGS